MSWRRSGMGGFFGRRVLVIEDNPWIAQDLCAELEAAGAFVFGPVAGVADAHDVIMMKGLNLEAAIVDLALQDEMAYPLVDLLVERAIPFVFATGLPEQSLDPRYTAHPHTGKPSDLAEIARILFGELLPSVSR